MAKARKPFISRKRRREMDQARQKRESLIMAQQEQRTTELTRPTAEMERQPVSLPTNTTVAEFSKILDVPVVKVISQLMKDGVMAAITARIDYDTMAVVADELGFIPSLREGAEEITPVATSNVPTVIEHGVARPSIVTVMGHVDHGKTSLLDRIRKTNIAQKEYGGITQHIGAYQVEVEYEGKRRLITFLDTPGHEAFTALRSHGAQVTDIVILVVAADDGVKPQTVEAINHAKSAHVPILVAITKTDLPTGNIDRVKQQLTEHGLIPEEWGGDTVIVPVSSVTGDGIKELLEYIILTADLKNYKADPDVSAQGVVIESHQETGLGPVATVLIQNGTLRVGDVIVIGQTHGKIRSMSDYTSNRVSQAGPGSPVRISGLEAIPDFGESFAVVKSEKEARELVGQSQLQSVGRGISDISQAIAEGRTNTLNIILKADTQGSLEALRSAIGKLEQPGVKPIIIQGGIGDINLSDIQLAVASQAVVFGFNVVLPSQIKRAADNQGVTVATYKIIYDLLDQIGQTLKGRVTIHKQNVEIGRFKVKKVFRTTKEVQIIGGEITQGLALNGAHISVLREGEPVTEGQVLSLQKGPEPIQELEAGQECGLSVRVKEKVLPGDVIVFFKEEEVIGSLEEDLSKTTAS